MTIVPKKIILLLFAVTNYVTLVTSQCGQRQLADNSKIVNGVDAIPNEFPWQAALKQPSSSQQFCGGALVSSQWVVTAAHCIFTTASNIIVVLGEHDFSTSDSISTEYNVAETVKHPDYDADTFDSDIGLLKLSTIIPCFTDQIAPICIPTTSDISSLGFFGSVTVSGWGTTTEGGSLSSILQKVSVTYIPTFWCKYLSFYSPSSITNNMVCAGGFSKDSCQGDSGGPVMYENNGVTYLVGVVSWGRGCARFLYPGVYTKVVNFNAWINSII